MGRGKAKLLTDLQLRKWVKAGVPVAKSDGDGLTFTLSSAGTAAWVFRYRFNGRRQEVTLGRYPDPLSLDGARIQAARKRLGMIDGIDPSDEKRKAKSRSDWTVKELIADYEALVLSSKGLSTQVAYRRNLKRVERSIGTLMVTNVSSADVVAVIEKSKVPPGELASLQSVLRGIFHHALGKRVINAAPTTGVRLEAIVGEKPKPKTRLMLTADEIHLVMNAKMSDPNRLAVSILLGTGVRSAELYTARWDDVHLDDARWHIPASKTGAAMDIPLPTQVVEWFLALKELAGQSGYVLPARRSTRYKRVGGDAHIAKDALREAIDFWIDGHKPEVRRFTPHDLRSTMKSHMRRLGVSRDISEMCLNHKLAGVEGIYDQYTYYEERRAAFEKWLRFLSDTGNSNEVRNG